MTFLRVFVITAMSAVCAYSQILGALMPVPKQQFFSSTAVPLAGGMIYTYAAGTTAPQATYTDSTLGTANTNPIVLDSAGRAGIWLGANPYKVVLQDALGNVIWTVDNVTDLAQVLKVQLAGIAGASLIGWESAGTGATVLTQSQINGYTINAAQFGVRCDGGITDNAPHIRAAMAWASTIGGGVVQMPANTSSMSNACGIRSSVDNVYQGVRLIGAGTGGTTILPISGGTFSTCPGPTGNYSYVLSQGGCATTPIPYSSIENMTVSINGLTDVGVYSASCQENCFLDHLLITGYIHYGILWYGFGIQNSYIHDITCYADGSASASDNHCIYEIAGNSRNTIDHVTAIGNGVSSGIAVTSVQGEVSNVHCENSVSCVEVQGGQVFVHDIDLTTNDIQIAVLIHDQTGVVAEQISKNGAYGTVTICDQGRIGTSSCGGGTNVIGNTNFMRVYSTGGNHATGGGNLLTDDPATLSFLYGMNLGAGGLVSPFFNTGHETYTDAGSWGILANIGSDISNPQGFLFQNYKMTNFGSAVGGGLQVMGGFAGSGPDGSVGQINAGATSDGGTYTARTAGASGILLGQGTGYLYGATGLTAGSGFSPSVNGALSWGAGGITGTRTNSLPGVTSTTCTQWTNGLCTHN